MRTVSGHRRPAVLLALLVAAALAAALLTGLPADAKGGKGKGKGKADVAEPYSGYSTKRVVSGGGFLGARSLGGEVVYRIDPQAKRPAKAYGGSEYVGTDLPGTTAGSTARAAWIVSKYGAFKKKVQSAAVEVALDDLLVGGKFALRGSATKKRLRATGRAGRIVKLAKVILKGSIARAGDYTTSISAPAVVDATTTVDSTVTVLAAATGAPVASLPVEFSYPGAESRVVSTGADGRATASFTASAAGPATVTAVVDRVPENRLVVRRASDAKASPVVVAQAKTRRVLTAGIRVVGTPGVAVSAPADQSDGTNRATLTVSGGYASRRVAHVRLFGPNAGQVSCSGPVVAEYDVAVSGGSVALSGPATFGGHFAWSVSVPGDDYNRPASTCGGETLHHLDPVNPSFRPDRTSYTFRQSAGGTVTVDRLPAGFNGNVEIIIWGPWDYNRAQCGFREAYRYYVPVNAPHGMNLQTGVPPKAPYSTTGDYTYQVVVPASTGTNPVTGPCNPGAFFRVTQN